MAETVVVARIPKCDLCTTEDAVYDSKMKGTTAWAFLCQTCWDRVGVGRLGTGYGQRVVLKGGA